jgi:KaiC/GvpD/RAD55 family RecA-like ATPase
MSGQRHLEARSTMLKRAASFYMDLQAPAGNKNSVILIVHFLEAFSAQVV